MPIRENIKYVNQLKARAAEKSGRTGEDVLLVAVTKLHDVDEINEAIECGITDIGENKVQEIMNKYDSSSKEHKYSEQMLNSVVVLKLTVRNFCCKAHRTEG